MASVVVEEVTGGKALARFIELPHALHGDHPCFAPLVLAWERYRLDPHRNPFFERGDGRYFLARRQGRPVGRITAQVARPGDPGRFGFWWVDEDTEVASALLAAARGWLAEQGCPSMEGPYSFTPAEEAGVLVGGFEVPGATGRPWHPPHLARLLEAEGFTALSETRTWRVPAEDRGLPRALSADRPGHAGAYGDPRLVLDGVAAVPDLSDALRGVGLRSAWSLARRARRADWTTATVVSSTAPPDVALPAIQTAAHRAGYRWVITPWPTHPDAQPETTHRTYVRRTSRPAHSG